MNNSFYKILKFELKLNIYIWLLLLASAFAILTFFFFKFHATNNSFVIGGSFIPMFTLISCIFTLHSYSESTTKQSMAMYHLIPVSTNKKFFSKQLITFIIFPVALLLIYLLFVLVVDPLFFDNFNRSLLSPNFRPDRTFKLFLVAHSVATFLAVVLKKRKLLYTILIFLILQFSTGIVFALVSVIFKKMSSIGNIFSNFSFSLNSLPEFTHFLLPLFFYIVSYRLFFKRQL